MRIWIKEIRDTHLIKDITVENYEAQSRTAKVFAALEEAAKAFDLSVPIWLSVNIEDFKRNGKARFTQDSFIEPIDFDYLEFQVIEEDY